MSRQLHCPRCQSEGVLRSRQQSPREHVAALFLMAPFHCLHCRHRFLVWRPGANQRPLSMDRREHLRIPVRLFLSFSGGKVRGDGMVMDLSMGGCVIKSSTLVHIDDIFYLEIAIKGTDAPIEVAAMVRSISARGIAFKFLRQAQDNKRLLAFIQSHAPASSIPLAKTVEPASTPSAP
jgi:hypothetical protein